MRAPPLAEARRSASGVVHASVQVSRILGCGQLTHHAPLRAAAGGGTRIADIETDSHLAAIIRAAMFAQTVWGILLYTPLVGPIILAAREQLYVRHLFV